MDRNQKMAIAIGSVVLALFAVTAVTAHSLTSTPLYTFRMEQASNKMNFLPTAVNHFTYTTEKGCSLNYNGLAFCGVNPLEEPTAPATCPYTCDDLTCEQTCPNTCWNTCDGPTCQSTCPNTCDLSCQATCPWTCRSTCTSTCWNTCKGDTCWDTCEIDCFP